MASSPFPKNMSPSLLRLFWWNPKTIPAVPSSYFVCNFWFFPKTKLIPNEPLFVGFWFRRNPEVCWWFSFFPSGIQQGSVTLYDLVLVDAKKMHCHCVYSSIYPLFRLKWPYALNVFNFFFVVLNHLASPIFRNHTTPVPPQVGTLLTSGHARAASAITSWKAVCSITCRLRSQEQIAILTSLHVLYLMVRDAFPTIILNLSNNIYASTCWVKTSPPQQKHAASITFHFRICHVTYKIDLSTSTKKKGSVSELTWSFEI